MEFVCEDRRTNHTIQIVYVIATEIVLCDTRANLDRIIVSLPQSSSSVSRNALNLVHWQCNEATSELDHVIARRRLHLIPYASAQV